MNNLTWSSIVIGGVVIAAFGLLSATPVVNGVAGVQAQDVLFLMSGGLVTSMIGAAGLCGMMGQRASVAKITK